MDSAHSVIKSAKSFLAGTLLSRLSGFFRDIAISFSFGSSPEIAAFMVAYRLANLFRRLLGEGNLQAGFVPHFASLKEEGGHFFRDVAYSLSLVLIAVVLLLELILWGLRGGVSPDWQVIVDLTMWMVPGLFFICLYSLNSSLLQCREKYFIPAVAPVAFNLIWILAVLIKPDVTFLAIAITLAFAGQWFVTVFEGARLLPLKEWSKPKVFSPEFKKLIRPLLLGIVGVGAVQFNGALDTIFARIADLKGPAFLWYAIRLQQLPLALFGIALSGALLPPLTRASDPVKKMELLQSALKTATALMLIATFGILAVGDLGVNLLYGHGDFTPEDVIETSRCLWGYGLGLVPSVWVLIFSSKFYSEKNYRTPMMASLFSVVVNLGLNALFVFGFGWGAVSIAIATTLSSLVNAIWLSKESHTKEFWLFFSRMALSCMAAMLAVWLAQSFMGEMLTRDLLQQTFNLAILGSLFLLVLWACFGFKKLNHIIGGAQYKQGLKGPLI